MKKYIALGVLMMIVFACHRKTAVPTEEIIISNKSTEDKPTTKPPTTDGPTDIMAAGKTIYTTRCNRCHKAEPIDRFTTVEWENILKSMIPKARLNEEQSKIVTAYIMAKAKT